MAIKPLKSIKFPGLPDVYTIESGLSDAVKEALLACFRNVAWTTEEGQQLYNTLYNAFYPDARIASLSAVFTQGSRVITPTDSLDSLKQNLVVTATYYNGTTATITDYVLSGELTAGTSIITAIYGGKTATFNVNVSSSYRYITSNDIDFQSGIVGLNVSDGNIEYTGKETTSATAFAVLMFKPSIKHIEFVYKPSGEKSLSRRPPFRIAIAKRGNNFIGCDHTSSYLFTPNASGGEYSATKDTSLSTVTCNDAAFIGIASSGWDGYFNNKTFDVIIENGVITISGGGYYCTYSNAELIGIWIDGKPCQKLYDVKVYEE